MMRAALGWGTRRRLVIQRASLTLFVAALLLCATQAPASRFEDYSGQTSQGRTVELGTDNGVPDFLLIYSYRAPCDGAEPYIEREVIFNGHFDVATRQKVVEKAHYRRQGTRTGAVDAKLVMHRVSKRRWNGTFKADVKLKDEGVECHGDFSFDVRRSGKAD